MGARSLLARLHREWRRHRQPYRHRPHATERRRMPRHPPPASLPPTMTLTLLVFVAPQMPQQCDRLHPLDTLIVLPGPLPLEQAVEMDSS